MTEIPKNAATEWTEDDRQRMDNFTTKYRIVEWLLESMLENARNHNPGMTPIACMARQVARDIHVGAQNEVLAGFLPVPREELITVQPAPYTANEGGGKG